MIQLIVKLQRIKLLNVVKVLFLGNNSQTLNPKPNHFTKKDSLMQIEFIMLRCSLKFIVGLPFFFFFKCMRNLKSFKWNNYLLFSLWRGISLIKRADCIDCNLFSNHPFFRWFKHQIRFNSRKNYHLSFILKVIFIYILQLKQKEILFD